MSRSEINGPFKGHATDVHLKVKISGSFSWEGRCPENPRELTTLLSFTYSYLHRLAYEVQSNDAKVGLLLDGTWGMRHELSRHYPFDLHVFRRKTLSPCANRD